VPLAWGSCLRPPAGIDRSCRPATSRELTPDRLRKLAHAPKGAAVEEDSLDELLGQVPSEDRAKFQKLRQVIQEHLSGVKVYRVGDEPERALYIVGKTKDGKGAGLKATVVET
jgi:hypothetical protein